ncbi:MAG: hypothetical protein ABIY55_06410 [Kofleriaceae bacterium]
MRLIAPQQTVTWLIEMVQVATPKLRMSKTIASARSAELFDDMARVVGSRHVVLASTPTFDTATIDGLDEATCPLFVEMETLDRGVVMVHSNDGKQYFVLRRSGAQTVAYATSDVPSCRLVSLRSLMTGS